MQPCSLMLVSSPSAASAACLPARMRPHWEFGSSPSPLGCPVSGWAFCNAQLIVNSSLQKQNQCRLTSLWRTWQYRMLIEMKFVITHLNNKLVVFARAAMSTVFLFLSVGKLVSLQHNEWNVGIFSVSPSLTHTRRHTHLFLESVFTIPKRVSFIAFMFGHVCCSFPVPAFWYSHQQNIFSFTLHLLPSLIYFHPWVAHYLLISAFPAHTPWLPLTQPWLTLTNVCNSKRKLHGSRGQWMFS